MLKSYIYIQYTVHILYVYILLFIYFYTILYQMKCTTDTVCYSSFIFGHLWLNLVPGLQIADHTDSSRVTFSSFSSNVLKS